MRLTIVATDGGRVLGANGERVHARGDLDPAQPSYGIFRRGKVYADPQTQELLGINADDIGTARFVMAGDLTTLAVQRVTQEVRPGRPPAPRAIAYGAGARKVSAFHRRKNHRYPQGRHPDWRAGRCHPEQRPARRSGGGSTADRH